MSTDARPHQNADAQTSLIGIDAEGSEHRYDHLNHRVIVVRPTGVRDGYDLDRMGLRLTAFIARVEDRCGWADLRYGEDLLTTIERALADQ